MHIPFGWDYENRETEVGPSGCTVIWYYKPLHVTLVPMVRWNVVKWETFLYLLQLRWPPFITYYCLSYIYFCLSSRSRRAQVGVRWGKGVWQPWTWKPSWTMLNPLTTRNSWPLYWTSQCPHSRQVSTVTVSLYMTWRRFAETPFSRWVRGSKCSLISKVNY